MDVIAGAPEAILDQEVALGSQSGELERAKVTGDITDQPFQPWLVYLLGLGMEINSHLV